SPTGITRFNLVVRVPALLLSRARVRVFSSALANEASATRSRAGHGVQRAAEPPRIDQERRTIMAQLLRFGVRIRQSDVAVRPEEVECRARDAGAPHPLPPLKMVEWKMQLGADLGHAGPRHSVHVDLPRQRSERGEVVLYWPR